MITRISFAILVLLSIATADAQTDASSARSRPILPAPVISIQHTTPAGNGASARELTDRLKRIEKLLDMAESTAQSSPQDPVPRQQAAPPRSEPAPHVDAPDSPDTPSKRVPVANVVPWNSPTQPWNAQGGFEGSPPHLPTLRPGLILSWRMSCGGLAELWLHENGNFCFHQTHGRRLSRQTLPLHAGSLPGWRWMVTLDDGTAVWQDPTGRQIRLVRSFVTIQ